MNNYHEVIKFQQTGQISPQLSMNAIQMIFG